MDGSKEKEITYSDFSHITNTNNKKLYNGFSRCLELFRIKKVLFFLSQVFYESNGLQSNMENLNYSEYNIIWVFGKYFSGIKDAKDYAYNPVKLANYVYSNRMGNGNILSGDGYRYRGRGFMQITGRNNYASLDRDFELGCLDEPDILVKDFNCWYSAGWFWVKNSLDEITDFVYLTKCINGGYNGLPKRYAILQRFKKYFKERGKNV